MSEDTAVLEPLIDERSKVEGWRLHVLIEEARYPVEIAERLAVSEADLHLACTLRSQGCDPALAAEILL